MQQFILLTKKLSFNFKTRKVLNLYPLIVYSITYLLTGKTNLFAVKKQKNLRRRQEISFKA